MDTAEHGQTIHPSDKSVRIDRQTLLLGQEQGSFQCRTLRSIPSNEGLRRLKRNGPGLHHPTGLDGDNRARPVRFHWPWTEIRSRHHRGRWSPTDQRHVERHRYTPKDAQGSFHVRWRKGNEGGSVFSPRYEGRTDGCDPPPATEEEEVAEGLWIIYIEFEPGYCTYMSMVPFWC